MKLAAIVLMLMLAGVLGTAAAFAQPEASKPAKAAVPGTWSIILATFRGPEQAPYAAAGLKRVHEDAKIADAFTEVRGEATVVAVGRFNDPTGPDAVRRLEEIRNMKVGGGRPFLGAFLAPAGDARNLGSRPEYSLLKARDEFGARAQYSLQIAVYARDDLKRDPTEAELAESRKAAEDAAARLRQEGELAFYFHGPRRSMVTIGVWSDDDIGQRGSAKVPGREENPELTQLKKRFPQNLYNGAGLKEKNKLGQDRIQASQLVKIPER